MMIGVEVKSRLLPVFALFLVACSSPEKDFQTDMDNSVASETPADFFGSQ